MEKSMHMYLSAHCNPIRPTSKCSSFLTHDTSFVGTAAAAVPWPKLNLLHSLCWTVSCTACPPDRLPFFVRKILTNALALHIWCLATPPPRMIIPVLFAATAMLLILVISEIQFTLKVRTTETTVSVYIYIHIYVFLF